MNTMLIGSLALAGLMTCLGSLVATGATHQADAVIHEINAQLRAASTSASGVDGILKIARQAGEDYGQSMPVVAVKIFHRASLLINYVCHTNRSVLPAYWEMATRQRDYLDALPFVERLQALNSSVIPLRTEVRLGAGPKGSVTRGSELELLLQTWDELAQELAKVKNLHFEDAGGFLQPQPGPVSLEAELQRQEANARWKAVTERNNYRQRLQADGSSFTNRVIDHIALEYGKTPHLVAQLQEVMDGYLPPEASTNIMNKVFEAMRSPVAAKTPRPVPGAKGERWIRVAAVEPRGEPPLPAIARPSRFREAMNGRGSPGAGAAAEPAGGRAVWPWALLGLAGLAGGWVWLRTR